VNFVSLIGVGSKSAYANRQENGKEVNIQVIVVLRFLSMGTMLLLFAGGLQARSAAVMEIAPGVFMWPGDQAEFSAHNQGHIANIGFIVGTERVAVIDTGSSYRQGLELRKAIRETTQLPIAYVILTHMHPDHVLGAAAFEQDKPTYIGHGQLPDALARRQSVYLRRMQEILGEAAKDTQIVFPSKTVAAEHSLTLELGGRRLLLQAYPTAHTNNDLSIYDEKTGTLWLSDLLFVERIPVVDGSILGWLKVIDKLSKQACIEISSANSESKEQCAEIKRIVPGHGSVTTQWQQALADQRRYLDFVAAGIRKIISKGGSITQAVESVGWEEQEHWLLFKEFHGRNVTAVFAELEWE
jgi:quinoprotein relay system zinc metallohydrolase 2